MSKPLKAFDIEFVKLGQDEHWFDFDINNEFFEAFESSLTAEDLKLKLSFTKGSNTFKLLFLLEGKVNLDCDRCLSPISLPINSSNLLMVKITENLLEDQDDIIYMLPSEYKINIAQPLFDFILISLPIKSTCDMVGKVCDSAITGKITDVIDIEMQAADAERATDFEEEE
jgi:uncharacterized metal-binding protein YceD (DUF177 family)